jgi:hypothetical protein
VFSRCATRFFLRSSRQQPTSLSGSNPVIPPFPGLGQVGPVVGPSQEPVRCCKADPGRRVKRLSPHDEHGRHFGVRLADSRPFGVLRDYLIRGATSPYAWLVWDKVGWYHIVRPWWWPKSGLSGTKVLRIPPPLEEIAPWEEHRNVNPALTSLSLRHSRRPSGRRSRHQPTSYTGSNPVSSATFGTTRLRRQSEQRFRLAVCHIGKGQDWSSGAHRSVNAPDLSSPRSQRGKSGRTVSLSARSRKQPTSITQLDRVPGSYPGCFRFDP